MFSLLLHGFRLIHWGFNKFRPVVAVDGTHLKGKYKDTLFVVAYLYGNEQIHLLAFDVGDTENEQSYTWFFTDLSVIKSNRNTMELPDNIDREK